MKPIDAEMLARDGFLIVRQAVEACRLPELRKEADAVARAAGSTCVRHLRSRSAVFDALAHSDEFSSLLPMSLRPVRSILFDKTAEENWPVAWHQDLTICLTERHDIDGYGPWSFKEGVVHVQPPIRLLENMVTIRLHLDPTPASNGALKVMAGSHRHGRLSPDAIARAARKDAVTCECDAGDVLLMHPLLLHASSRSSAPARRRVVHIEYAHPDDLPAPLAWHE
jgi:hypothetical protein